MRKLLVNKALFFVLVLFSAGVLAAMPSLAQDQEDPLDRLFTIQAIKVDETASRASVARQSAIAKAEQEAYSKLLRKLTQPEGRAKLPVLSAREIQAMISGIEVVEEQSSSRRYLATLDVRFEPGIVSQFLAQYKVPHVLGTGRGILVVHAHSRPLLDILWENDVTLDDARQQVDWLNRIRQYVFPVGEMGERAQVTFEEISALDVDDVDQLARNYDVRSALLITSDWREKGGKTVLSYRFFSTDGGLGGEGEASGIGTETSALIEMYDKVLEAIDSAWRGRLLVDTGEGGTLEVMIPTTELTIYNRILHQLDEVSLVNSVERLTIGLPFSRIRFQYTGRRDQLVLALRYSGLSLSLYGEEQMLSLRDEEVQ